MMNIKVSNKLNYYLEALGVLTSYMREIPIHEDIKLKLKQKYNIPFQDTDELLKDISIIHNDIISALDISKENLIFFTTILDETIPSIKEQVINYIVYNENEESLYALLSYPVEVKRKVFVNLLFADTEYSSYMSDNINEKDFVNCLNKLNIDNDSKVRCILLYYNIDDYLKNAVDILNYIIAIIKQHNKEIQKIVDKFQVVLQKEVDEYGEQIFDKFDIKVAKDKDIVIKPIVMYFNSIMIKPTNESKQEVISNKIIQANYIYAYFGVYTKEIIDLIRIYFVQDEKIISIFKALGDKSKFDILKKVKDNKMYGTELAKTLNLTTATVSHHMNHLYNLSLVNIITDSNKINYILNKDTIVDLIHTLEKLFLN